MEQVNVNAALEDVRSFLRVFRSALALESVLAAAVNAEESVKAAEGKRQGIEQALGLGREELAKLNGDLAAKTVEVRDTVEGLNATLAEVQSATDARVAELASVVSAHEQNVADLEAAHRDKLESMRLAAEARGRELEQDHRRRAVELEDQEDALHAKIQALQGELEDLRARVKGLL